ncbi:MAG: acyl-CoA dehydrogenase family protein [Arthrobacter sp.]|jgi:alkylation response protein AidB-like acyl-CoA dehydrogenase|nr:acyl-CoA dehydrogenase family protein [Arthrobacter sp.]
MSITTEATFTVVGQHATAEELAAVRGRLAPALEILRHGVIERDAARELPREGIVALARAGFAALRVPRALGGAGLSLTQLFAILTEVAAADPNAAQALRGHLAFVEDRLVSRPGPEREAWFERFVAGELVGNAWTDAAVSKQGQTSTTLSRAGEDWALEGTKYYSTGSIFAQWIDVYAHSPEHGGDVIALVRTDDAGVRLSDDWTGFGQRTTGTGTTVFTGAKVQDADVVPGEERFGYQTAFYQQVLLATLAGIARNVADDAATALRSRARGYSHGAAASPAADPQLLQVIGELDATAFAAAAVVDAVSGALEGAAAAAEARWSGGGSTADADQAAERASARGQVALSASVPAAATRLFDALGASGTSVHAGLDRHWRNARTAATHNPWVYKARILGDGLVNDVEAPLLWSVGSA